MRPPVEGTTTPTGGGGSGGGIARQPAPTYTPPRQVKPYKPRSGGGGGGGSSSNRRRPPAPKPKSADQIKKEQANALAKWLAGDTTYQQQVADFNAENSAYKTNYDRQNQVTNRDYATTNRSMNTQATTDRTDQQYDFAGRGVLHSGVFAKALGDYNTNFNTKVANLLQGKTDTLSNAQSDYNNFLRQLKLQQNSAKQDAIRRRQQSLGI